MGDPKSSAGKESSEFLIAGGLLRVYNLGVLIIGDSGIGKSETALELVSRGHDYISDDVTAVEKTKSGRVVGRAPKLAQNFMEIRGLGVINIKEIFGSRSIRSKSTIDLVIELKKWEQDTEYDRLGLDFFSEKILAGHSIPLISIPVAPGRNNATLIEVACRVHLLKQAGYHAPEEISRRLERKITVESEQAEKK